MAMKENNADCIATEGRQVCTELDTFIKEKFMRGLNHDTGAITCIGFAAAGAAMLHIFQYRQCIGNILVTLIAFDAGDKTDTTCIMFKAGIVQTFVACHR